MNIKRQVLILAPIDPTCHIGLKNPAFVIFITLDWGVLVLQKILFG